MLKKNALLISFLLITFSCSFAQDKFTISGYVKEAATGESMIGASVYIKELSKGTAANIYGFYSLTVDKGNYTLIVSYLGFVEQIIPITLNKNTAQNIFLVQKSIQTNTIEIMGERPENNVQSTNMGTIELSIEKIKSLPAFMGEVDILKTIQLLPGIKNAGEGNSGFYVRGGGPDQNLILLDEAVVYNASHLFGFFSVFNSDAVKNVNIIKGGMPANYGGRLASVLDISMKEGNNQSYHADGGIGLISSRLTLQGPIKKDKSSFILSGRRTYIDVLTAPFVPESSPFKGSGYYFYDLNTKLNYQFSDKDKIFFSGYLGRDVFTYKNTRSRFNVSIPWGNATAALRWNHLYNEKLFMNASLIFTDYQFASEIEQKQFQFKLSSGIRDWNAKVDFSYFPTIRHNVKFGFNYIFHTFTPSSVSFKVGTVQLAPDKVVHQYANDGALYITDDFDLTEKIKINAGLRYSVFQHIGPYDSFIQDVTGKIIDTVSYTSGQNIKVYQALEPRISLRYALNLKSSLKASYTYNNQYLHLAAFSTVTLPTDIWVPASSLIKPQTGNQYAIGYFRNFKNNRYETSIEAYYKDMNNLIEYRDGTLPQDNTSKNIENNVVFGKGESYGTELFIKKALGRFNGWIGYTLSWTSRTFEDLNRGKEFYARYDRRHDLSVVTTYELNPKWTFSAVFVYGTGNAITLPVARYFIQGNIIDEYGDRNAYRMSAYHRIDVSVTYTRKKTEKFESSWNFSIYNVYDRRNPYFIYFDNTGSADQGTLDIKAKQVSLFPILPSVTYNFKF